MSTFLFAVLCAIWSTTWIAIRVCEQGFSPIWGAALRFGLAALILALFRRTPSSSASPSRLLLPAAGLANAVSYSLIYFAEQRITGGTAAVLGATNPFFTCAAVAVLGYERLTLRKVLGIAVGFFGVCLLLHSGLSLGRATVLAMGEVLVAAALLWPLFTVLLRRAGDAGLPASAVTFGFVGWTALFLLAGAVTIEGVPQLTHPAWPSLKAALALLYLAVVGTAVAWSLFNLLLRRLPMTVLSTMLFIEPALALGVDWLFGDTAATRASWAGAGLILLGVLLSAIGQSEGNATPKAPARSESSAAEPLGLELPADA